MGNDKNHATWKKAPAIYSIQVRDQGADPKDLGNQQNHHWGIQKGQITCRLTTFQSPDAVGTFRLH